MGIDDESRHPGLCSEVAGGVTRNIVCLFREPDAGNLPVRFDEREQETGSSQTGLRWAKRKLSPTATGRLTPLRLFSTLLVRREKALDFSGCNSRPGTGSLHPVAIEAAAEATKLSELSMERVARRLGERAGHNMSER